MPLEAKKIAEFRKKIATYKRETALKEIAKLNPKVNIPIILKILNDIHVVLSSMDDAETKEFLAYGIKILTETDEKQNVGLFKIKDVLKSLKKETIVKEMQCLVEYAQKVKITKNTEALWQEAALFLEGMYKRTYDMVSKEKDGVTFVKNKDGSIPPIDIEDRIFHGIVGLNKIDIASYYHHAAEALEMQLIKYKESITIVADAKQEMPLVKAEENIQDLKIETKQLEGYTQLVIEIPDAYKNKIQNIIDAIHLVIHPQESNINDVSQEVSNVVEDLPPELLELYKDDVEDVRFSILVSALDQYKLNDQQRFLLKNSKEIIQSTLDSYLTRSFSTYGIPTLFRARPHVPQVKEKQEQIQENDDPANDVKSVFSLWADAKAKNSKDIRRKTATLLDSFYIILLKSSQPAHIPQKHSF